MPLERSRTELRIRSVELAIDIIKSSVSTITIGRVINEADQIYDFISQDYKESKSKEEESKDSEK